MPRLTPPAITPGTQRDLTQPVLDADGLRLRPWRADDAAAVVAAYADPDIRRWHDRSMDPDEADRVGGLLGRPVARRDRRRLGPGARRRRSSGQISLRSLDHGDGRSDISYWVLPQRARTRGRDDRADAP